MHQGTADDHHESGEQQETAGSLPPQQRAEQGEHQRGAADDRADHRRVGVPQRGEQQHVEQHQAGRGKGDQAHPVTYRQPHPGQLADPGDREERERRERVATGLAGEVGEVENQARDGHRGTQDDHAERALQNSGSGEHAPTL